MSEADTTADTAAQDGPRDFVREVIRADLAAGRTQAVVTRFPPEPNGYLHIGHAKSMCLNFGVAQEFGGRCHLRFDDTNPVKEEHEYIEAIEADVHWMGFDWKTYLYFASDYFQQLYDWAEHLIQNGKAYVDDLSAEEIRAYRGTLTEPGQDSPFRGRPVEENLELFRRMRSGDFPDGTRVLRARIDMAAGNMNLRDPVLYRILHAAHPRTGEAWCIYPTYDFAHGQSDAIEGVTHSICTLEFEDHRPLYDWLIENLPVPTVPRQYEFARLNLSYTVLSKRRLIQLVDEGHVKGWDDPRMPTLRGLRRRGVPPAAIRDFCQRIGVTKNDTLVDMAHFEHCMRELLNKTAERRMAVLRPLKVVIENYPEGESEELEAVNNPEDPAAGTRAVPGPAEEVLQARPRPRGAAALRLLPDLPRGGQGRCRRDRRARLHLRPGDPRRQRARRPQGQGHAALGLGRARARGRGAALRPPVPRARAGRRGRSDGRPQSGLADGARGLPPGAGAGRGRLRGAGAVRAARLFLSRSGRHARASRLQPHRRPARHLGQGPGPGRREGLTQPPP
jgi:glutamyl/glutaminyl-tRNA synthetase